MSIAIIVYNMFYKNRRAKVRDVYTLVFSLSLFFVTSIIVVLIHEGDDLSYFNEQIIGFVKQVILLSIPFLLFYNNEYDNCTENVQSFMILYIRSIALYIAFSLFFLIPECRNFWAESVYYNSENSKELISSLSYYTRFGLQGFSGFRHAILSALAMIFSIYLFMSGNREILKRKISLFLIIIGCFIYGRISIVSVIVCVMTVGLYSIIRLRHLKILFLALMIMIILSFALYINIDLIQKNHALAWIFEPLLNFINSGGFSSHSTDELSKMYIMPSDKTILIGDGFYSNRDGSYYMHTDVGFLRPIFFGGIFLLISYYSILIIPLFFIVLKSNLRNSGLLVFLVLLLLTVIEFKGESLISISAVIYTFLLFPLMSMRVDNEKNR
ncbi:hypothetical protein ACVQK0_08595 [Edwardsiella tarda]